MDSSLKNTILSNQYTYNDLENNNIVYDNNMKISYTNKYKSFIYMIFGLAAIIFVIGSTTQSDYTYKQSKLVSNFLFNIKSKNSDTNNVKEININDIDVINNNMESIDSTSPVLDSNTETPAETKNVIDTNTENVEDKVIEDKNVNNEKDDTHKDDNDKEYVTHNENENEKDVTHNENDIEKDVTDKDDTNKEDADDKEGDNLKELKPRMSEENSEDNENGFVGGPWDSSNNGQVTKQDLQPTTPKTDGEENKATGPYTPAVEGGIMSKAFETTTKSKIDQSKGKDTDSATDEKLVVKIK